MRAEVSSYSRLLSKAMMMMMMIMRRRRMTTTAIVIQIQIKKKLIYPTRGNFVDVMAGL